MLSALLEKSESAPFADAIKLHPLVSIICCKVEVYVLDWVPKCAPPPIAHSNVSIHSNRFNPHDFFHRIRSHSTTSIWDVLNDFC